MHRSRVSTVLVDVGSGDVEGAVGFWAAALGVPARPVPGEPEFTDLPGALPDLELAVQAVDDAPRYHLDLETDDVDAETARLVGLGAVRVGGWAGGRVLRAPGGHLLCVIPRHSDDAVFDRLARTWT